MQDYIEALDQFAADKFAQFYFICLEVYFKWANAGLFLIYFPLFKQTLQVLQQLYVKKCSSVLGFEPTTFTHDSFPITTRPGLPSNLSWSVSHPALSFRRGLPISQLWPTKFCTIGPILCIRSFRMGRKRRTRPQTVSSWDRLRAKCNLFFLENWRWVKWDIVLCPITVCLEMVFLLPTACLEMIFIV